MACHDDQTAPFQGASGSVCSPTRPGGQWALRLRGPWDRLGRTACLAGANSSVARGPSIRGFEMGGSDWAERRMVGCLNSIRPVTPSKLGRGSDGGGGGGCVIRPG